MLQHPKRTLLLGLLASLLLTSLVVLPSETAPATPALRNNINKLKENERELEALKRKIEQLKKAENQSKENIAEIQERLEKAKLKLEQSNRNYELVHKQVEEINQKLEQAEDAWDSRWKKAQQHMREMYKRRRYLTVNEFIEIDRVATLRRTLAYYNYLSRQDEQMLSDLKLEKEKLERYQFQKMLKRQDLGRKAHEQAEAKEKFEYQKDKEEAYQARLRKDRQFYEREAQALESESRRITAMLQRMFSSGQTSSIRLGTGRFTPSVPGAPITSRFGYRIHPIFKTGRLHSGMDYGAAAGTPIRAVDNGVVLQTGWMGGYGKAVIVDHGQGLTTLYAHSSAYYVRPGQAVRKGQVIAAIGSTGFSTGPHLHLEVRRNGVPIDPYPFF